MYKIFTSKWGAVLRRSFCDLYQIDFEDFLMIFLEFFFTLLIPAPLSVYFSERADLQAGAMMTILDFGS